ncbi:MAG: ATP-binding protein [Bdellovibrionota bacterium]
MNVAGPQLNLRSKLYISFLCVIGGLCVGVLASRYLSEQLAENFENITGNVIPVIRSLNEINAASLSLAEASVSLWHASRRQEPEQQKAAARERGEFLGARDELREAKDRYLAIAASSPVQSQNTAEISSLIARLQSAIDKLFVTIDQKGAESRAHEAFEEMEEVVPKLSLVTRMAADLENVSLHDRKSKAESTITDVVRLVAMVLLFTIGFVGAVGVGFYGSLFGSIVRLKAAVEAVGAGALNTRVEPTSNDEIGSVIEAFNRMVVNLESTTISTGFLESVLSSLLDGVIVVNSEGTVVSVNDAFLRLADTSPADVRSRPIDSFLSGITFAEVATSDLSAPHGRQVALLTRAGDKIDIALVWAPLKEGRDNSTSYVLVARDIRAQLEAEAELRAYRKQLDHAQQLAALGSVSALLAHKVNQPLTVLQLLIQQSLRDPALPQSVKDKLAESLEETRSLSATFKEVLRFTRPAEVKPIRDVSLFSIAEKLCTALEGTARDASISLDYAALLEIPPIQGVEEELEEMFFILIENAIQAAPKSRPATLRLSAEMFDDVIQIHFVDSCQGIAQENLNRIFDLFFTTKPRNQGTGLGLGIVKQILIGRGGDIAVESRLGEGSRFTVRLPLKFSDDMTSLTEESVVESV